MKKILDILFSLKTSLVLLALLGLGAAVATFIENDFGTSSARVLVYNHWWYETVLILTGINIAGVIYLRKMWKQPFRFMFHISFIVILLGAGLTRYVGQEGILHIREGKSENRMITAEPYLQVTISANGKKYYQDYPKDFSSLGSNDFAYDIDFDGDTVTVKYKEYTFAKKGKSTMGLLTADVCYKGKCQTEKLVGQRGMKGYGKDFKFGDINVYVEFGSKVIELPFSIKLKDFQLDRYPGSMAPSSYASEVTVIDGDEKFDYRIFMNHTLDHRGYKFFQSSYDQDELGTILSVNDDPGKWPTYIGYLLLTIGLFGNLFTSKSRFGKLIKFMKSSSIALVPILFMLGTSVSHADSSKFDSYIEKYKDSSLDVASAFSRLIVQAPMGRMEPMSTLNTELVYKLHGSLSYRELNQDQIIIGMLTRPEIWRDAKMMKIKSPLLKKALGLPLTAKYTSFADAFKDNEYKLKSAIEQANRMNPNKRGTFEREAIALDEKLNVIYMVFYGNIFKIYPLENDPSQTWYNPLEAMDKFAGMAKDGVTMMTRGLIDSVVKEDWASAIKVIDFIDKYQHKVGGSLIPHQKQIDAELFYNNLHLFPKLVGIYMILGMLLLIAGFMQLASSKDSKIYTYIRTVALVILFALFFAHTLGLGLIWYISGHAPWSNAYESLLYISWSAMLAGLVFFRRSLLVLSATVIVAGIFVFTAHLSNINPQITNLVPVLKSYWLTIHVSIITASYGFLGLGAIVSYIVLLLFITRSPKRTHIDQTIYGLMAVTEATLIIGLSMLAVGNFIGGVWANESWGRYWGWDPKETWAYVSIVAYTVVLHLRLVKKLDTPFVLATASFLAFSAILMTYFGVNFYLSGMHSYAAGDPIPVPTWVYYITAVSIITIAVAYQKRGLGRLKLPSK